MGETSIMKKLTPIIVICILSLGSLSTIAMYQTTDTQFEIKNTITFSSPYINTVNKEYLTISYPTGYHTLKIPGKPLIPVITQHFELPFGASNIQIIFTPQTMMQQTIVHEILPASPPNIIGSPQKRTTPKDHKSDR